MSTDATAPTPDATGVIAKALEAHAAKLKPEAVPMLSKLWAGEFDGIHENVVRDLVAVRLQAPDYAPFLQAAAPQDRGAAVVEELQRAYAGRHANSSASLAGRNRLGNAPKAD